MTQPIHILHIVGGLDFGGIEMLLMNLYRQMNPSKVQFDFVKHTAQQQVFDAEVIHLGGHIYSCPRFRGYNFFAYLNWWKRFFKEHPQYHIVHGHIYSTAAMYLYVARKYGLTTIIHAHVSGGEGLQGLKHRLYHFDLQSMRLYIQNSIKGLIRKFIAFPIRYLADYFFACSQIAGKWIFGHKITTRQNYFIVSNAIDTANFAYNLSAREHIRQQLHIENNWVLGNVGRFVVPKNQMFLLKIFAEVYKQNPAARLLLVGDGPLKQDLIKQAQEAQISQAVIFSDGQVPSTDYYQAMDVFVFPSLYEGLGIVLIEAQTSGLPCVISANLPQEADLQCGLVTRVNLQQPAAVWAQTVLEQSGKERTSQQTAAQAKGYDIISVAQWLQGFYTKESAKYD